MNDALMAETVLAKMPHPDADTMADTMYRRVAKAIADFEANLGSYEEVGARLAQFGQAITIAITGIGYSNPYLFKIVGVTPEGDRCELIQHVSQVNILLVALKAKGEPRRIGFRLTEKREKPEK